MALSVSANGGNGLANLFRQARPLKLVEDAAAPAEQPTAVSLRPIGRSGIDSTGSGTAQISAALTICLSKLGGGDDQAQAPVAKPAQSLAAGPATARSSAAELLRALDAYGASGFGQRLTA